MLVRGVADVLIQNSGLRRLRCWLSGFERFDAANEVTEFFLGRLHKPRALAG